MRRIEPLLGLVLVLFLGCGGQSSSERGATETPEPVSREERAWALLDQGALLVDVRTPAEYAQGHLEGAINIPHDQIARRVAEFGQDKGRPIVVYCRSGRRSGIALETLDGLGFTRVHNGGGYDSLSSVR